MQIIAVNEISWSLLPMIFVLPEGLPLMDRQIAAVEELPSHTGVARVLIAGEHLRSRRETPGVIRHVQLLAEPNTQPFADGSEQLTVREAGLRGLKVHLA